jgi:3-methyladenine DNA glycosylase AlkD
MLNYVDTIISSFQLASNPQIAKGQSAYVKNRFVLFGIKSPERQTLQQPFFQKIKDRINLAKQQLLNHFGNNPKGNCSIMLRNWL